MSAVSTLKATVDGQDLPPESREMIRRLWVAEAVAETESGRRSGQPERLLALVEEARWIIQDLFAAEPKER